MLRMSGSAADQAGLKPGDCVMRVNGESVLQYDSEQLAKYIRSV